MTIFFTSDNHFGHANVIKYSKRPYLTPEQQQELEDTEKFGGKWKVPKSCVDLMDQDMIVRWNQKVNPSDTVYLLGDFAFGNIDYIISILRQLNGNKVIVTGNHDRQLIAGRSIILNDSKCCVSEINTYAEMVIEGHTICLFHYPLKTWNKKHYGSIHLYGHVHGSIPVVDRSVDVGVDAAWITGSPNYSPISWPVIRDYILKFHS